MNEGASLVEVLVALVLGLFVLHLGHATLGALGDARRSLERRVDLLTAERVARTVLRGELRHGVGERDWHATADSIGLRAYRGVCSVDAERGRAVVTYRGDRRPSPVKDSLEVLDSRGRLIHRRLDRVRSVTPMCSGLGPDEVALEVGVEGTLPGDALLLRPFESGSYHLHGAALRYRVGRGGRQPLTPEVWEDAHTRFLVGDAAIGVRLTPRRPGRAHTAGFLAWRRAPR